MCKEHRFDSLSGLEIDTWCGNIDGNDSPVTICDIDDRRKPKHYVQIRNSKTLSRKVLVKGLAQKSHAKFEGDPAVVTSEIEWAFQLTISGKRGLDIERLSEATISKKKNGDDKIKVEVEYFDQWDPSIKWRADEDDLEFKVNLV